MSCRGEGGWRLGRDATLGLQVARMVKEAAHPGRRVFRETTELLEWLEPVLSPEEKLALGVFVGGATL